jgi:hypothetical protein
VEETEGGRVKRVEETERGREREGECEESGGDRKRDRGRERVKREETEI